jgi:hypothetical protein
VLTYRQLLFSSNYYSRAATIHQSLIWFIFDFRHFSIRFMCDYHFVFTWQFFSFCVKVSGPKHLFLHFFCCLNLFDPLNLLWLVAGTACSVYENKKVYFKFLKNNSNQQTIIGQVILQIWHSQTVTRLFKHINICKLLSFQVLLYGLYLLNWSHGCI